MALIRILIDGYSLLHEWTELAPGKSRMCEAARNELIQKLKGYQTAVGTPITVVFDGSGLPNGLPAVQSTPEMEVLFSGGEQTAYNLIERAVVRLSKYGEVMVVTDDSAERGAVISVGGTFYGCSVFIQLAKDALNESQPRQTGLGLQKLHQRR